MTVHFVALLEVQELCNPASRSSPGRNKNLTQVQCGQLLCVQLPESDHTVAYTHTCTFDTRSDSRPRMRTCMVDNSLRAADGHLRSKCLKWQFLREAERQVETASSTSFTMSKPKSRLPLHRSDVHSPLHTVCSSCMGTPHHFSAFMLYGKRMTAE